MLRRRPLTFGVSALMLVAGIAIVVAALSGFATREKGRTIPGPSADLADFATPKPSPTAEATPIPEPTPEPSSAPVERIMIPRLGIDAPIVVLGIDANGAMQDPKGPREVAWYNFSSRPGWGSNAVFAGHVDYINYGPAVFWRLRDVQLGDEIKVVLADGVSYTYRVVSANQFSAAEAPVQDIVGPTDQEVVTLITCGGTFNTRTREYDRRLIVRAERTLDTSARAP